MPNLLYKILFVFSILKFQFLVVILMALNFPWKDFGESYELIYCLKNSVVGPLNIVAFYTYDVVINFKYSNCSRAKTVNENLKMSAALLSRFDLVFILLDKPNELLDKRLSEHIMQVSVLV